MIWLVPTVTASTMIAQVMGCAQGKMSQPDCGNFLSGREVPVRGEPAQCSYSVATVPGEVCG